MGWLSDVIQGGAAILGVGATNSASKAAQKGADNAAALQNQQYLQNRQDLAPYREVGTNALNAYARAMGLAPAGDPALSNPSGSLSDIDSVYRYYLGRPPTEYERNYYAKNPGELEPDIIAPGQREGTQAWYGKGGPTAYQGKVNLPQAQQGAPATSGDRYGGFETSPGYQFRLNQGTKLVNNNMAARGLLNSGSRAKALTEYGQGFASNEYGNYLNQLAGAAGIGQTATNSTALLGANYANSAGNNMQNSANARASGYMGMANTAMNGINNYFAARSYGGNARSAGGYNQPYDPTNPYV